MAKIGFLGLGEMGTPMATRLLRGGHELVVWNRSPERTVPLANEGAAVATSPAKAASGAELIITMLATPEALEQLLFGSEGLAILIDMSTVGPDEVRSAAARLPEGVTLVDAPVRGSVPQATSGAPRGIRRCDRQSIRARAPDPRAPRHGTARGRSGRGRGDETRGQPRSRRGHRDTR